MTRDPRYWRPVLLIASLECIGTAIAVLVMPAAQAGHIPMVGGLLWIVLALPYLAVQNLLGPLVARIESGGPASAAAAAMFVLVGLAALVLAMVVWLPFYLARSKQ